MRAFTLLVTPWPAVCHGRPYLPIQLQLITFYLGKCRTPHCVVTKLVAWHFRTPQVGCACVAASFGVCDVERSNKRSRTFQAAQSKRRKTSILLTASAACVQGCVYVGWCGLRYASFLRACIHTENFIATLFSCINAVFL